MITNRGFLVGLIHRGVRQTISEEFGLVHISDLHGDSNVGEVAPSNQQNENVFDIQQGVAIGLFAKIATKNPKVLVRDLWGTREEKYAALLGNCDNWIRVVPKAPLFLYKP